MKLVPILSLFIICEVNSVLIYQYDGRAYYVSYPEKASWYEAVRFCSHHGTHLVEAYHDIENTIILSVIERVSNTGDFWMGGTNFGSEKQFYWTSTGRPFIYSNWVDTRNETSSTSCVYYDSANQHQWNDIDCSHKLYFICRHSFDLPVYTDRECSIV